MPLRWFHKLGLTIIDKLFIAFILFLVSLDVSKGFNQIGFDLVVTILVVFVLYIVTVFIASIPRLLISKDGKYTNWVMGGFTALIIWLLFPKLLEWFFIIANFLGIIDYQLSMPLSDILLWTFVIRAFLVGFLARRWGK